MGGNKLLAKSKRSKISMEDTNNQRIGLTTEDIVEMTQYSKSTMKKYAGILGLPYIGKKRKVYIWQEEDIERLKNALAAPRPRKKEEND
ncbi:MAG: hypothetical protein LBO67_06740 [Spirochaetaceae bacterium]|jgi:hypothetical protein|nr:hypothetical protein [Spirochaetaceae bacterium]